eukprot:XP_021135141.2 SMC5-SMC6 complex localization factor protein 2 isoform X2 [Anas platyrhynchos]
MRNQSIKDFFKPVLKQDLSHKDRSVLCSSDVTYLKDAGNGLPVLSAERFEKKISSAKKVKRKKMPDQTPNTSPVLDAFRRGIKEKRGNMDMLENNGACKSLGSVYPRVVVRKLLVNSGSPKCLLTKNDKAIKTDQGKNEKYLGVTRTPLSCGNCWEQETDFMDLEETSSDSNKWISLPQADAQKACAQNNDNTLLCQNLGLPTNLPCTSPDSTLRLALGTLHRERKCKKRRVKRSKAQPVMLISGTSVSHQENGYQLRNITHSGSGEAASDDPTQLKQFQTHDTLSEFGDDTSSKKAASTWESQSVPSAYLQSNSSSGPSKQIGCPGKRKHSVMSVDANGSEVTGLSDPAFNWSPQKSKSRKSAFVKNVGLKSLSSGVLQLTEVTALPGPHSAYSEEYPEDVSRNENEKNNYSSVDLSSFSAQSPNENNQVSLVDTKENQLQVANSHSFLEKSLPSQEKSTVLPSLHHIAQREAVFTKAVKPQCHMAGLPWVLDAKMEQDGKRPERLNRADDVEPSNVFSKPEENSSENASDFCLVKGSGKLSGSEETDEGLPCLLPFEEESEDSNHASSQLSQELKVESTCSEMFKVNGKSKISFDSEDESLGCALDDDDDEEPFVTLQEILSATPKPQTEASEGDCSDSFSQDTVAPLLKLHLSKTPVVSQVSYVNSLEHLLKEKEESKRLDELEKLLQENIQEKETDSSDREDENVTDEDLSEEHRAFIKRFSLTARAIPDYHPGEDIFDLTVSGKIFNQHDLDLRNFYFIPQNPIEKLLLSSDVTQQLFLALHGFLSSAYSCSLCPAPILKWLFQMMSVHPGYCVSLQILNSLMEITVKNASISDEQSKPWIPSLADVSTVFVNMGVTFASLFPLEHLQPNFNECDILSQMQGTVNKQQPRESLSSASPAFASLPENNLMNVIKFLDFCTTVVKGGYTDQEILLLLLLLFKISLEKQLKQVPLTDFQCLFIKLLISIKDWDTKMPELCLAVSELSSQHHNLLWLVQLVPSWIIRGREVRRRLSLVIIAKLLNQKHIRIPDDSDKQMSLLHQYLVYMKPSNLLEKMRTDEQQNVSEDHLHIELEQEVYYLVYILLHLVSEASCFDTVNSNQRQHLLKLCGALDKHIKCDIREDARLFYRTKVKDLVARIYSKWQDMIQTTRLSQGKLHDFWEPDS